MFVNFCGNQFSMDFVRFLLYAWYNICSNWFLDIGISTCFTIVLLQFRLTCKKPKVVSAPICIEISKQYCYSDDCSPFC